MIITYLNKSLISLILSFLLHLFSVGQVSSSSITQKGHYYGKNLFIQNTEISTNEFSVYSVYVNEIPINSTIDSNIIEVDFSDLNINKEDPVTIIIRHNSRKIPILINPEVLIKNLDSTIKKDSIQSYAINNELKKSNNKESKEFNESRYKYYLHSFHSSSKNKFRLHKPKKSSIQFNRGEFKIKYRY